MKILKPRGMNLQKYKLPSSAPASSSFNFNLRAELELVSNYPHHPPNHPPTPEKVVRTVLHLPRKLKFGMETLFNQTRSTS